MARCAVIVARPVCRTINTDLVLYKYSGPIYFTFALFICFKQWEHHLCDRLRRIASTPASDEESSRNRQACGVLLNNREPRVAAPFEHLNHPPRMRVPRRACF